MYSELFLQEITNINGIEQVQRDVPMSRYTTFKTGGPADFVLMPGSIHELMETLEICRRQEVPFTVVGRGSNLLVSDEGYRGAIILINKNMERMSCDGDYITAEAGATLYSVAALALSNSLAGFEFASGIPGTIGGACVMNAGAYGGEMKDVLVSVKAIQQDGTLREFSADELKLGYRTSIIPGQGLTVAEVTIKLEQGDPKAIRARMDELKEARISKQPLNFPSAGSTFKRPTGNFAGKLIQEAGLRGYSVGDAEVSTKHCGFVVNKGRATSSDVYQLIQDVICKVNETSGITLEPEVKFLGKF